MVRTPCIALLTLLLWGTALCTHAGEVRVAVAANFASTLQALRPAFERETGHTLVASVGSTGRFYAQIVNGAPFDVLLSADDETPARLEREGHAIKGTRLTYAVGRLVLWSAQPGRVDAQGEVLRRGQVQHIALADPRLSPYGAAAVEVMERLGVRAALQPRWVLGESVGQAYQFVASGNAPLGFVALAQVAQDGRIRSGSGWIVPASLHTPLRQDAVLLARARDNAAARALLAYLRSDAALRVLQDHGYER